MKHFLLIILLFFGFALGSMAQSHPAPSNQGAVGEVREGNLEATQENGKQPLTLFIPNAFTPNDDGINDIYYIQNSNFRKFEFAVFDRYGNQIFATTNSEFRWDGRVGGRMVPMGSYVYIFHGVTNDDMTIKRSGTITIVR
ncbi:MAG: gliding motility-associated C-terminal domain-containing protein [Bacteroidia bacterium]|nr:gliding motility-associated C-terminal domain-containing protein [Bacteroidia bacterium]